MNKKIITIIAIIVILLLIMYLAIKIIYKEDDDLKIEIVINSPDITFLNKNNINITCSIFNKGDKEIRISGNNDYEYDSIDIYENGHLNFEIRDSSGNLIEREGGIHGIGNPYILSPGENLTVIADLNKYYPLENTIGPITVQGIYRCAEYLEEAEDVPTFDEKIESNILRINLE